MPEAQIASLRITPDRARPGEPVLVEALDANGQLVEGTDVVINGVRGARQFLQFEAGGDYRVQAIAGPPDVLSAQGTSVSVAPDTVVAGVIPARFPLLQARRPSAVRTPYSVAFTAQDTEAFTVSLAQAFDSEGADSAALTTASMVTSWTWDFGTGEMIQTTSPEVEYDFEAHLAVDQEHQLFDVRCDLALADGTTTSVARTLSVVNAYAVCRARGVLAPPVTAVSTARKVLKTFQASAVVRNPEAFPVTLTSRRFQWGDAENETMTALEPLAEPIVIPEGASVTLSVGVGFNVVPAEVRSFTVLWLGRDDEGRVVHVEATFDVPLPDHRTNGIRYGDISVTRMLAQGIKDVERAAQVNPVVDPDPRTGVAEALQRLRNHVDIGGAVLGHPGEGGDFHPGWGKILVEPGHLGGIGAIGGIGGIGNQHVEGHAAGEVQPVEPGPGANAQAAVHDVALRAGIDLDALHAVVEPAGPVGVTRDIASSLSSLLGDDTVANLLTGGGGGAGIGRVEISQGLLDLSAWAETVRQGLSGPAEGRVCDPDNLPEDAGEDWACQVVPAGDGSPEMLEWHRPTRFVNARKGDLILAPGGPAGFIGGLLGQVTPPQRYAHMGIMTRNYDMITHCTFADERLKDHPNGSIDLGPFGSEPAPTDGFDPDVLRYGWPGTITQWVSGATDTGQLADPAAVADPTSVVPGADVKETPAVDPDGKTYNLTPFDRYPKISRTGESWQVVPPLVVKPNPALETTEVRQALHRLADACRADTGKTHYSFYAYTDARKALTDTSTVAGAWHEGTYPAVCSSFIWAVAGLGLQLEGPGGLARPQDLEPTDAPAVEVGDGTPDGLYLYREDERTQAAHWFHERLRNEVLDNIKTKVRDKIGDLGKVDDLLGSLIDDLSDMADDVANQMCNAFASDWCEPPPKTPTSRPPRTRRRRQPRRHDALGRARHRRPVRVCRARGLHATHRRAGPPLRLALRTDQGHHPRRREGRRRPPPRRPRPGQRRTVGHHPHRRGRHLPPPERRLRRVPGQGPVRPRRRGDLHQVADDQPPRGQPRRRLRPRPTPRGEPAYVVHRQPLLHEVLRRRKQPPHRPALPFAFTRGVTPAPDSMRATAYTGSDFHGIFGVSSFLFNWLAGGTVQWAVNWSVCQDSALADQIAHALTDAADDLTFGWFLPLRQRSRGPGHAHRHPRTRGGRPGLDPHRTR